MPPETGLMITETLSSIKMAGLGMGDGAVVGCVFTVGIADGVNVGETVGNAVAGGNVGGFVGLSVGSEVSGAAVGRFVGSGLGGSVSGGVTVGSSSSGCCVGGSVCRVGLGEGAAVGSLVGDLVGFAVSSSSLIVGELVGFRVGGVRVGLGVSGRLVGSRVGGSGSLVGCLVGRGVSGGSCAVSATGEASSARDMTRTMNINSANALPRLLIKKLLPGIERQSLLFSQGYRCFAALCSSTLVSSMSKAALIVPAGRNTNACSLVLVAPAFCGTNSSFMSKRLLLSKLQKTFFASRFSALPKCNLVSVKDLSDLIPHSRMHTGTHTSRS